MSHSAPKHESLGKKGTRQRGGVGLTKKEYGFSSKVGKNAKSFSKSMASPAMDANKAGK